MRKRQAARFNERPIQRPRRHETIPGERDAILHQSRSRRILETRLFTRRGTSTVNQSAIWRPLGRKERSRAGALGEASERVGSTPMTDSTRCPATVTRGRAHANSGISALTVSVFPFARMRPAARRLLLPRTPEVARQTALVHRVLCSARRVSPLRHFHVATFRHAPLRRR